MQTNLTDIYRDSLLGQEAETILRACVHCGFCTATCPTYQLLSDELDGPRGRIYLIKQVLEGEPPTARTQSHLDRCLSCRSCETTCPSGVRYGRLVDIGRELVEQTVPRRPWVALQRYALRKILPYPRRFAPLLRLGQLFRPLLPGAVKSRIPARQQPGAWPEGKQSRTMLVLQGCAQSVTTPATNTAAAQVLARLGIGLIAVPQAGCCGALDHHLADSGGALAFARRNIDAWWPFIENGAEAIIATASGCGLMLKDYGHLLQQDAAYADKARRIAALSRDLSEVLRDEDLSLLASRPRNDKIAYHSPCTLQHGQQLGGVVEDILQRAGFHLTPVADAHLCCGAAGTYSILQKTLAGQLLENKLDALEGPAPDIIATANVGCQLHLGGRAQRPVVHWIELLAR
jgi:glycolate oxidase iron-sulfur subunit